MSLGTSADGRIEIVLQVGDREYRRAIGEDTRLLERFGFQSKSTAAAVSVLRSGVAQMFGVFSAAATARYIYSTAKEFEALNAQLLTVEKSEPRARIAFQRIQEFAAATPYQLQEVVQAFINLRNFGLDPSEEALTAYGNTAASMGKSLDQMIQAVADAATGEFERLKEFGIKSKQEGDRVKFTFRGVTTEVGKNAQEIEQYLQRIGLVEFAGGMKRQMDTLTGVSSNLGDAFAALSQKIDGTTGFTAAIKEAMRWTTSLVNELAGVSRPLRDIEADIAALESRIDRLPRSGRASGARVAAGGELEGLRDERLQALLRSSAPDDLAKGIEALSEQIARQREAVEDRQRANREENGEIYRNGRLVGEPVAELRRLAELQAQYRAALLRLQGAAEYDLESKAQAEDARAAVSSSGGGADKAIKAQERLQDKIGDTLRQRELEVRLIGETTNSARLHAEIELGFYDNWKPAQIQRLRALAEEQDAKDKLLELEKERQQQAARAQAEQAAWVNTIIDRGQKRESIKDIKSDLRDTRRGAGLRSVAELTEEEVGKENAIFDREKSQLDEALFAGNLDSYQQYLDAKEVLTREHAERLADIERASNEARRQEQTSQLDYTSDIFGQAAEIASMFGRKGFETFKALAVAEALISAPSAAMKAYERGLEIPGIGLYLAPVAAVTAFTLQMAKVAQIQAASYTGRQFGGDVYGGRPVQVGEFDRPELYRENGRLFLLPGDKGGTVSPAKDVSSSQQAASPARVTVHNYAGVAVQARQMSDGEIQVMVGQAVEAGAALAERRIAQGIQTGRSPVAGSISTKFGVQQKPRR